MQPTPQAFQTTPESHRVAESIDSLHPGIEIAIGPWTNLAEIPDTHDLGHVVGAKPLQIVGGVDPADGIVRRESLDHVVGLQASDVHGVIQPAHVGIGFEPRVAVIPRHASPGHHGPQVLAP